ncbi:hypothetical protein [Adhaeribacter pallidiroseus]|nr:hypothetical protein [Adhaeribacter pallidiroseus]
MKDKEKVFLLKNGFLKHGIRIHLYKIINAVLTPEKLKNLKKC